MAVSIPKSLAEMPGGPGRFVGREVRRIEDPQLVTGKTEFVDNIVLPGMLHAAILRSPFPHARIKSIDTSAAEALEGVVAVATGEDARRWTNLTPTVPEGWGVHCLAGDKVRFVGEPLAAVAATSRYVAEDALELIEVDYEPIDVVVDPNRAIQEGSPLVFEDKGTNVMFSRVFNWGDTDAAFAEADHVYSEKFRWHRLGANPLETFGVVVTWDPIDGTVDGYGSFQSASQVAQLRSIALGVPSNKVRMMSQPHGGSFGGKGGFRGVDIAAILSRKAGGKPVKWIEDRMEYLIGGAGQSWDRFYEASLAVKSDGTVTGLKVRLVDDMGATAEAWGAISCAKPVASFTGCYAIPTAQYDLTIVATNKLPQAPYRGMGPPPHNLVLEQLMDIAAADLGMDPGEIRRRNFIPSDAFPYTIASGNEYDSGDYEACLDAVLEMGEYKELRRRQTEARDEGRLVGLGLVSTIEPGVFDWNAYAIVGVQGIGVPEGATVSMDIFGKISCRVGFGLEGQGQYTLIAQILADYFGTEMDDIRVIPLDTLAAPPNFGPGGSRLGVAISGAVLGAAELLKEKLLRVAAVLLQTEASNLELAEGVIRIPGVEAAVLPLASVTGAMLARSDLLPEDLDPNPEATYVWTAPGRTPADEEGRAKSYLTAANACHLVMVEIDRETGQVEIQGYWIADDCGTRLNPATVDGMIQGGVAQGVGAALLEEYVYDEDGQLLTSTFMDYLLPSVYEVPMTEKRALCTPSPFTPLGAKGCGESAMHTTPAAIICAINDALLPLGTRITEVPASPNRLWDTIRRAG
ncbi:MAG: xanthine dehydrogenase family protein molybdopterin-binding subunit [Deltaproteobacteria bacterium]